MPQSIIREFSKTLELAAFKSASSREDYVEGIRSRALTIESNAEIFNSTIMNSLHSSYRVPSIPHIEPRNHIRNIHDDIVSLNPTEGGDLSMFSATLSVAPISTALENERFSTDLHSSILNEDDDHNIEPIIFDRVEDILTSGDFDCGLSNVHPPDLLQYEPVDHWFDCPVPEFGSFEPDMMEFVQDDSSLPPLDFDFEFQSIPSTTATTLSNTTENVPAYGEYGNTFSSDTDLKRNVCHQALPLCGIAFPGSERMFSSNHSDSNGADKLIIPDLSITDRVSQDCTSAPNPGDVDDMQLRMPISVPNMGPSPETNVITMVPNGCDMDTKKTEAGRTARRERVAKRRKLKPKAPSKQPKVLFGGRKRGRRAVPSSIEQVKNMTMDCRDLQTNNRLSKENPNDRTVDALLRKTSESSTTTTTNPTLKSK